MYHFQYSKSIWPGEHNKYFKLSKSTYDIRSKAVQGQLIKKSKEEMQNIATEIDIAIRKIFVDYLNQEDQWNVFNMSNKEYDSWFTELVLQ
ncbi:hypothetical protein [Bacillus proteolyticus]|uniref:hypothetical protein n=1 Tax=Bacillus proteolyticus TaxID=2026192 RepID=UPI003CFF18A4